MIGQKDLVSFEDPFPSRSQEKSKGKKKTKSQKRHHDEDEAVDDGFDLGSVSKKRLQQTLQLIHLDDAAIDEVDSDEENIERRETNLLSEEKAGSTGKEGGDGDYQGESEIESGDDVDAGDVCFIFILIIISFL